VKDVGQRPAPAAALRHALPYLRLFRGKAFVVKAGGEAFADPATTRAVLEQVAVLHQLGIATVLVHGGGPQTTEVARALGAEPRFAAGRRVTDERSLEAAVMALNGRVNTAILAACRALELPAVGLSGVDAGLLRARRRPPVLVEGERVDYGFVGDLEQVDVEPLRAVLAAGYLPVVSPLAADREGTLLNVNADGAAGALAVALAAEKLLFLTGAPGVLERSDDPRSLVSLTDLAGLDRLREEGALGGGMLPKAEAIRGALAGGVRRVHILGFAVPDAVLTEVFTNEGCGTMVVADLAALRAEAGGGGAG
jgi:acetylglutamate kinase